MKWIRYSKYTGEDLGIDAEQLLQALSDFLLGSGFEAQFNPYGEWNDRNLDDLKKAIQQALEEGKLFDTETLEQMMEQLRQMSPEQLDQLLDRLVQKMIDEGQITVEGRAAKRRGWSGRQPGEQSAL